MYVNMEPRGEERGVTGSWTIQIRNTIVARSAQLSAGVGGTVEWGGPGDPHSEPLRDTWTSDFLSRGEGREVIGKRLRDKTVPCQVQRSLMKVVTNSFPCGAHPSGKNT